MKYLVAIVLACSALFGAYSYGKSVQATADALEAERLTSALAEAKAAASEAARKLEHTSAVSMTTIDNAYQQGRTDAENQIDSVVNDMRGGAISLRDRFTCPVAANGLPTASTTTSSSDAGTAGGLQPADAEFLVRLAARADAVTMQLRAAQQVIRSMQQTCNGGAQ